MALFEGNFPYTNYHELNLDWIIKKVKEYSKAFDTLEVDVDEFKKWVQNYLDDLAVPDAVKDILDQWAEDGTLQALLLTYKNTALTSNDIDMENIFTRVLEDGRGSGTANYVIFQSMAMSPGGNFLFCANDETQSSDQCKLREYNQNGDFVREAYIEAGHCNGMSYADGKIYISWMADTNGSTDKVTVVDYATFTEERVIRTGINHRAIAYDYDKKHFIILGGSTLTIMAENLTSVIKSINLDTPSYSPDQAGQDIFYYNNMVGIVYAYPNIIYFVDAENGEPIKMYNPPQRASNTGAPFNEPESGYYHDGSFYITSFSRLDGYNSTNVICKINPWRNTLNGYSKDNRFSGTKSLFVDGDYAGSIMTGEETTPYKHIMQAVAAIQSEMATTTPIIVYCKEGTSVGSLVAHNISNIQITNYPGESDNHFTIEGLRLNACNNVTIINCNIKYDDTASTGTANARIQYTDVKLKNVDFIQDGNTDAALFATERSTVTLDNYIIPNSFDRGIVAAMQTQVYSANSSNVAAARVRTYTQSEFHSPLRFVPQDGRYYIESYGNTIRPWAKVYEGVISAINTPTTIGNASQQGLNNLAAGVTEIMIEFAFTSNFKNRIIFPVATDAATGAFQGNVFGLFGSNKWEGVCYGTFDLANKTITITNQLSFNHSQNLAYARSEGTAPSGTGWCGINGIWVR